jgi:hypothetical protein
MWLFSVTLRQGPCSQALQLRLLNGLTKIAVLQAKVSDILRPGNIAFKEQLKLGNGLESYYRMIHAKKKNPSACFNWSIYEVTARGETATLVGDRRMGVPPDFRQKVW